MNKYFVTVNAKNAPGTNLLGEFVNTWLADSKSTIKCNAGEFVYNNPALKTKPCNACTPTPGTLLVTESTIDVKGKGKLIHNIKCFGTVSTTNPPNLPNMCEIEGNSACSAKSAGDDGETPQETPDGLPIFTLVRDYQMTGGFVRDITCRTTDKFIARTKEGVTLGRLTGKGATFYTIEPQWVGNQPWISCIPEGEYRLKWNTREGSRYINNSFDVWTKDGQNRTLSGNRTDIIIHYGYDVTWTSGCIILGDRLTKNSRVNRGDFMVTNPQSSMDRFRGLIASEAILKIKGGKTNEIKNTVE